MTPYSNGPNTYTNMTIYTHPYYVYTTKEPLLKNQQIINNLTQHIKLYNVHINTNLIQDTPIEYKVKFNKVWQTTPYATSSPPYNILTPAPTSNTLPYNPPPPSPHIFFVCVWVRGMTT